MKMGDSGYFEREERHDQTTNYLRYHAKEAVAFALAVETMKNGAKDVIFKPYNIERVKEIVNKTFEKSK